MPASVQAGWTGRLSRDLAAFVLLDELRTISEELLIVCSVLGGIVGLYFSGLSITDASYRTEGFDRRCRTSARFPRRERCISRPSDRT